MRHFLPAAAHKCMIYEGSASEQNAVVVPFLAKGLKAGCRCAYLAPPEEVAMMRRALEEHGVDVEREAGRGALVLSSDHPFADRAFCPYGMIGFLRSVVEQSLREGYDGVYAAGDVLYELGSAQAVERLTEYEAMLERAFRDWPLDGICLYKRDIMPGRGLRSALRAHRSVYVKDVLDPENVFYLPPDAAEAEGGNGTRDAQGESMWRQLRERLARAR